MKSPVNVAITGAAGQIGYALAFRVASGAICRACERNSAPFIPGMFMSETTTARCGSALRIARPSAPLEALRTS